MWWARVWRQRSTTEIALLEEQLLLVPERLALPSERGLPGPQWLSVQHHLGRWQRKPSL
jgi:hypothetical protein